MRIMSTIWQFIKIFLLQLLLQTGSQKFSVTKSDVSEII
jgi:hypothetical protein